MSTKLSARLALFFIFGFLVLGAGFSPQTAAQTTDTQYFQGFETDDVWAPTQTVNRVPSGTNGIPSKTGAFHGEVVGSQFTNWGGYNNTFPTNGYVTTLAVYLNPAGPYTNDTRFDFSSAINTPAGTHRRDFVFNAGFYDDVIVPGMGDRFVISASNGSGRASSDPKNAARDPFVITAAGWYTLKHRFYDSGGGVLAVDMEILDAAGTVLKTWTLSDPSDIIGTTVGGNRYGWFANNEFPFVAVDDTERGNIVAAPATLVVNPTGTGSASDCNDTTTPASSTTIQGAVNAADPGDTIKVCPGVYPELVDVTKPLTILGAQSGVDARSPSRTGLPTTESVVTGNAGSSSFRIAADDVTIDGFTIQGNTDPNLFGAGVLIGANTEGTEIRNNIIQNNIVGLFAANDSSSNPTVISQNVFRNNNNPGPASGFGIYTDQFTSGGTLTNLLIDQNTFTGNNNGAIGLVSTLAGSQTNITISNNEFTVNGNAINVSTSTDLTITGNMIANSLFTQVFIDGSTGLNFSCNTVRDSASRGLRFADFGGGGSTGSLVNNNNFQNNTLGGIVVETGGHTNPLNAESNYYGSPSGPTHPNNPGGTGDAIIDPDGVVDFTPFLTEPANCSPALPRDCAQNSSPYLLEPDFTIASNPNCEYQYGNTATSDPDSPFTLYTFAAANDPVQGIDRRFRSPLDAFRVPAILGNRNATTTTYVDVEQDPDQLNLHPGGAGERSVLRFFVPQGGTYRIEGSFEGISTAGTTTDVLILRRTSAFSPSTELFSAEIQGYNDVETFDITLDFAAGEIIEFSVGTGNNGFSNDSTGLSGSITLVTPPTPTPTPTVTPSPSPTVTPVPSPTVTPVPSPTVTPVPSPTVTPTPSPTATPIPSPTVTPTPSPTATPTPSPTVTPTPTATPTPTPTPIPAGPPWEGDINRADPNVPDDGDGEVNNVDLFWYSEFAEGRHCPSEGVGGEFQRLDGNDSGGIDAGDYNYIFNVWLGLLPKVGAKGPTQRPAGLCAGVPPAPSESFATSSSGGFDSTMVRIASSSGQPGRTILVPIIVESAGNVRSAGFTINYDPAVLSFSPIDGFSNPDVLKGSGAGADQLIGVNSTDGSIVVGIDFRRSAGTDVPLPAGTRQVALLRFTINSDAAVGSSTPITLIPQTTVDASGKAMTNVTVQSGNISIGSVRSLSGRALSEDGRGIRGVTVILTDSDGNRKTVNTNSLGYYEFVDIEAEETYVISASSRRFRFLARTVTVNDSLTDIDLVAIE